MGAFFLFKSAKTFDNKAVKRVFADKGFAKPSQFILKEMTLWLYQKQLLDEPNYIFSAKGNALFSVGTILYKKRDYKRSLEGLLQDFEGDSIDYQEIVGAFCLIFYNRHKVYILTDHDNLYHIFTNQSNTILSSSFLALIAAHKEKVLLNKMAFFEQLTVGYISGTETSIKGISLVNSSYKKSLKIADFSFLSFPETCNVNDFFPSSKFNVCVDKQLEVLTDYYLRIVPLALQYGVDIGLSGGYDSRLNLLLADSSQLKIEAHTHNSAEHDNEMRIAEILAFEKCIPLKAFSLSEPAKMSEEEMVANLNDSLNFFDGRTNKTMGTFNDVHTKKYRIEVLGQQKFGLNGMGGELYRNHDFTYSNKLNFAEWVKYHVLDPCMLCSVPRKHMKELVEYFLSKYIQLLNLRNSKYIDFHISRRFFAEIWVPYSAGIKTQAENQLAFFLMPFTEYRIKFEALRATPCIGKTGKFQTAMLIKLDSKMAALPSSYGFGFDNEPFSHMVKSGIRCFLPDRIKNVIGSYKFQLSQQNSYLKNYEHHPIVQQCVEAIKETNLPINWNTLFSHKAHFERSVSMGYLLIKFSDKISLEST